MLSQAGHSPEAGYWVAFSRIEGIGPGKLKRLVDHFGSASGAWAATVAGLTVAGLDQRTAQNVAQARPAIDPDGERQRMDRSGVCAICWTDERYPRLLRHIANPPMVLYVQGELLPEDELSVAVVGTRQPSPYGRQVAQKLASELARARGDDCERAGPRSGRGGSSGRARGGRAHAGSAR
ncbi:MAG: DNA-processing protein DprA [Chloroflexota bacterium]